jgi:diguanylate cyclase
VSIYSREGKSLYLSPSIEKISGYSETEIMGSDLKRLVHPRDLKTMNAYMETALQNPGKPISGIVSRTKNKAGEWRWTEATITNLLHDDAIQGFVGNFRDITHKKEAEINLNKSYQMVMEQNRRLLNFSYIVSHNLRSHSSNIESILNLYKISDDQEEHKIYLGLLSKVSSALNQTLYDLNEVVSIQASLDITVKPLKMIEHLNRTLGILKVQIQGKQAEIMKDVPKEMLVNFNVAYLESVLLNLITNALRYSEPERTPKIKISGYQLNGQWVLEVADNGIGIDMERNGEKIFGLYKTFTKKANSRGVGLFITKNQIDAMGGRITVKSTVGEGTTFKIFFKP